MPGEQKARSSIAWRQLSLDMTTNASEAPSFGARKQPANSRCPPDRNSNHL